MDPGCDQADWGGVGLPLAWHIWSWRLPHYHDDGDRESVVMMIAIDSEMRTTLPTLPLPPTRPWPGEPYLQR